MANWQDLSKDVITHILKIKWEWVKYISKNLAENIFLQLSDPTKKTIIIANTNNFTYIQKYRNELTLTLLDRESMDFESVLYFSWLSETKKEKIRQIWDTRKKENKPTTNNVLKNIISSFK